MACDGLRTDSQLQQHSKSAARPSSNLPHRGAETLADVEIFRYLPPDALRVLSARCRWHRYGAHQVVFQCEDKDRDVFFLVSGRACVVYHSASGDEISFHDLRAGDMFGEFAAIDGRPRSADVIALSEALIARMTAETFWDVLRQYETVTAATLRRLTAISRTMLKRIIEFRTLPVRGRVHAELLRLARIDAPHLGHCIATIAPAPTHATIASRIDTHREAVTREFNELARVGLIERKGRAIIVRDVAALAELVHGELEHDGLLH